MRKCISCHKEFDGQGLDIICPKCAESTATHTLSELYELPPEQNPEDDKKVTNHPQRYNGNSEYECYKVLKHWLTPEQYKGFLLGNALKYQCRLGKKDDERQEIDKAEWYLNELKNCYKD